MEAADTMTNPAELVLNPSLFVPQRTKAVSFKADVRIETGDEHLL